MYRAPTKTRAKRGEPLCRSSLGCARDKFRYKNQRRPPRSAAATWAKGARSRSKPIGENQLDEAGNPVGIKSLIADFVLSVLLPGMVAPVRLGAVEVGKSVLAGQGPGTEDTSGLFFHLGICRKRYHRAAYVPGRFGHQEIVGSVILILGVHIRVFVLAGFLPIGLSDSKNGRVPLPSAKSPELRPRKQCLVCAARGPWRRPGV
jgi:hypothetical protein